MTGPVREAVTGLRARPGRTLLTAVGIALAAAMLGTAVTVGFSLATGFGRAVDTAGAPDVIASFKDQPLPAVDRRVTALPNVAARSYRFQATNIPLEAGRHFARKGLVEVLSPGRRGYAIVAGRDVSDASGEVVVDRGVADAWHLRPGDHLRIGRRLGSYLVTGVAVTPDNVAYPLAAARVYISRAGLVARYGPDGVPRVNQLQLWVRDQRHLDETLVQARETSFGLRDLRLSTRSGVQALIGQAAGIVLALLTGLSVIALGTAGILLAASAHAETQRRWYEYGVRRSVGTSRGRIVVQAVATALVVAAPAAAVGVAGGALAAAGPTARLLAAVNELPPGWALAAPLALCWLAVVGLVTATAAWPAWRAAARRPIALLRGAELASTGRGRRSRVPRVGLGGVGVRLATARRGRLAATVATLGASAAFVLLMLALASLFARLQSDPSLLGKRYQLVASLPADSAAQVRRIPGVAAVAPRYTAEATDSYDLGQTVQVVGYPGDHTAFEAPPLAAGRRAHGPDEAEVGIGLADALGLRPGATLALALQPGGETRFRVVGVVRALDQQGRVAYVSASRLVAADPGAAQKLAVRLDAGADRASVQRALRDLGGAPAQTGGVTSRAGALLSVLTAVLRVVAVVDALVCLYALLQALALVARERGPAVAVLRACGAGRLAIGRVLAGTAAAVLIPAAVVGVATERWALGPALGRLAAGYVTLPLTAGIGPIVLVLGGLAALAVLASALVAHRIDRTPIVAGLVDP